MPKKAQDQELFEKIVRSLVEHPQDVRSERVIDSQGVLVTLYVNPSDMRFVLGRDGKTVSSLRVILKAIGARSKTSVNMKIFEPSEAYASHLEARSLAEPPLGTTEKIIAFQEVIRRPITRSVTVQLPKANRKASKVKVQQMTLSYHESIEKMERRLGVEFKNKNLLLEALTHRSYLNEHKDHLTGHNERLEFLGDAVLEIVATEFLFQRFPDTEEGVLTNYRAALVSASTLSPIAESFGVFDLMFFSKGERKAGVPGSKARMFICANVFEAILGALYLDQGMGECRLFIDTVLFVNLSAIIAEKARDPKSTFQEEAQKRFGITPHYKTVNESGPDHEKKFVMGLYLKSFLVAQAEGCSKQEAQVAAAKLALETKPQWEGRVAEFGEVGSAMRRSGKGVEK